MIYGDPFTIEVVSPVCLLFSKEVIFVEIPGQDGDLGILKDHQPMFVGLRSGIMRIVEKNSQNEKVFIGGGFARITGSKTTILTDECLYLKDIQKDQVESFIRDVEEKIQNEMAAEEKETLFKSLQIERAKLEIIKRLKNTK